jgi:hypothetical protein
MEVDEEQLLFSDNSAALLKLYLKHDLLEEATEIAMYMFKNTKVNISITLYTVNVLIL